MDSENTSKFDALAAAIRKFWKEESDSWDQQVDSANSNGPSTNIWDSMPEVDSKTVARTSRIFEDHLGIPLDVTLIKSGGYGSIEEVIDDIVQPMIEKAEQSIAAKS